MRGRKVLTVYAVHEIAELPDHLLYHLLLTSEAVERLRPTAWEIPLHGDTTTPDAYLIFPWGKALLEVDTGHYSPEAVRTKLRTFRDPLYWATLSPERLAWVFRLSRGLHQDLRPLLLAPPE